MKKILISMMLLTVFIAVHAQDDEFMKEVDKTIEISHIADNFSEGMKGQMQQFVDQGLISSENVVLLVKDVEAYAVPLLKNKVRELYKKHFTLDEVRQMNAYLSSPLGQKAQKLLPEFFFRRSEGSTDARSTEENSGECNEVCF